MDYTTKLSAADGVRRALALAVERPALLDKHDADVRQALPAVPPALAAVYERFRAESADGALAAMGEVDGDAVAKAVGAWAQRAATAWRSIGTSSLHSGRSNR